MFITKDLVVTFKNDIGSIDFSLFSEYTLIEFEEELQNSITTTKQNLIHGNTYISNTLDDRYITINGVIECNKYSEQLRLKLIRILNPNLKGRLIIQKANKYYKTIDVYIEKVVEPKANKGIINFEINLVALSPFWQDEIVTEYLALLTPTLKFPVNISQKRGITFGRKRSILESEVENIGDVESGFKVIFKAKGGTVKSPKVYDVYTKQFIKINYEMQKGDILELINYPEVKKVTLNGTENAFKHLDIESNFFNLKIGHNKIGYIAEENTINLDVILWYSPRYLGV